MCVYFGSVSYRQTACRLVLFQTGHLSSNPAYMLSVTCFSSTAASCSFPCHISSSSGCLSFFLSAVLPSFFLPLCNLASNGLEIDSRQSVIRVSSCQIYTERNAAKQTHTHKHSMCCCHSELLRFFIVSLLQGEYACWVVFDL